MSDLRKYILLSAWSLVGVVIQIAALQWTLLGNLAGAILCGAIVLVGERVLQVTTSSPWFGSFLAALASLLGTALGVTASDVPLPSLLWISPLLAAVPPGVPALRASLRKHLCSLCRKPCGRLLSFHCPRCRLRTCENCWEFDRERCRLCEMNHIALLSVEDAWWTDRLGVELRTGACSLCLTPVEGRIPQWPCRTCGHAQCRSCWDDTNGRCGRCNWTLPGLPGGLSDEYADSNIDQTAHVSVKRMRGECDA